VIGNDTYQNVPHLKNARGDARAIAQAFEKAGFKVQLKLDVTEKGMKDAIRAFKSQVTGGDVAIFYFSGHGVQLGGANYLLPVDIRSDSEDQVRDEAVPLQRVLDDLQDQKAKFSLAIIDACRNNPFKAAGRSLGGRGLAVTAAATGQMVLYSAGAGQQALDSLGPADKNPNGLFTRVLLKEIEKPGVPVDRVLRTVRDEVVKLSTSAGQEQVPALYDQALGEFYFWPPTGKAPAPLVVAEAPSALGAPPVASAMVGGLQVSVNVPEARVYVDDVLKGTASPTEALNLRDLPVGRVSVKVEAPGYPSRIQAVEITQGQWTQARLLLAKDAAAPAAEAPKSFWSKIVPAKLIGSSFKEAPTSTSLSSATMTGDMAKVKELLEAGAPINGIDKWGLTPIHWAAYYRQMEALSYLLNHGGDPNVVSTKAYGRLKAGSTPLVMVAYYGYDEPMELLLKKHADASIANAGGKTALEYATTYRFDKCAALLKGK